MTKYAILSTTILMIILSASLLGTASAQTYTPGVAVGDVFKYRYEFSTDVNGSEQVSIPSTFDALAEQAKTIDYIQMTVTSISGSTVTAQMLTQFKTGTQQTYTGTVDVATGQGQLAQFLIASNLTVNNPLHSGSKEIINGTTTKTYPSGVTRDLNYQNLTAQYVVPPEQLSQYNITVSLSQVNKQEAYWDKQTGALTQLAYSMTTTSTQVNATLTLNLNLVESNVFAVPEYPAVIVELLVMAIPTFVVLKKRKNFNF